MITWKCLKSSFLDCGTSAEVKCLLWPLPLSCDTLAPAARLKQSFVPSRRTPALPRGPRARSNASKLASGT
jgi:hypothetical protein